MMGTIITKNVGSKEGLEVGSSLWVVGQERNAQLTQSGDG